MKAWKIIVLCIVFIMFIGVVETALTLHMKEYKAHQTYNKLLLREKYLKLLLTNNKYSGYLAIKSHYEKKLMSYAIKHNDKFTLALAQKEKAELEYYKAGAK